MWVSEHTCWSSLLNLWVRVSFQPEALAPSPFLLAFQPQLGLPPVQEAFLNCFPHLADKTSCQPCSCVPCAPCPMTQPSDVWQDLLPRWPQPEFCAHASPSPDTCSLYFISQKKAESFQKTQRGICIGVCMCTMNFGPHLAWGECCTVRAGVCLRMGAPT